ncbi:unnamed protein product [Leptosia nina]|uniref:RNA-directed DNA polymerase from mobile element jockey n=1 Tax=Leptosia nina TaxID=320188 RepID=A0AAV1JPP2_9NEOP
MWHHPKDRSKHYSGGGCVSGPDSPTHYPDGHGAPDVIDFAIHKGITAMMTQQVVVDELLSDHLPIVMDLVDAAPAPPVARLARRIDWRAFQQTLNDAPQHCAPNSPAAALCAELPRRSIVRRTPPPPWTKRRNASPRTRRRHYRAARAGRLSRSAEPLAGAYSPQALPPPPVAAVAMPAPEGGPSPPSGQIAEYVAAPIAPSEGAIYFSPALVRKATSRLKPKKAPGADGITNAALRRLPPRTLVALTRLFNGILRSSHFPAPWKEARDSVESHFLALSQGSPETLDAMFRSLAGDVPPAPRGSPRALLYSDAIAYAIVRKQVAFSDGLHAAVRAYLDRVEAELRAEGLLSTPLTQDEWAVAQCNIARSTPLRRRRPESPSSPDRDSKRPCQDSAFPSLPDPLSQRDPRLRRRLALPVPEPTASAATAARASRDALPARTTLAAPASRDFSAAPTPRAASALRAAVTAPAATAA